MSANSDLGIAVVVLLLAVSLAGLLISKSDPDRGAAWLRAQGYEDVTGGTYRPFALCSKGEIARRYETSSGPVVVCHGLWLHRPMLQVNP